jgi:hypothetical protein
MRKNRITWNVIANKLAKAEITDMQKTHEERTVEELQVRKSNNTGGKMYAG